MIIKPDDFIPESPHDISSDLLEMAANYMRSEEFEAIYKRISQIDTLPKLSFQQMRIIKTEYMDRFLGQDTLTGLTNSARIMASWLDAVLEFTVLKHEALILTVKKQNVMQKIRNVSLVWPKKKDFIERAYKIMLFTKRVRPEINVTLMYLKRNNLYEFMNKEHMDKNRVYLKIKELETRELETKKLQMASTCTHHSTPEVDNRLNEAVQSLNLQMRGENEQQQDNSEMASSLLSHSPHEEQTRQLGSTGQNVEIQTEDIEEPEHSHDDSYDEDEEQAHTVLCERHRLEAIQNAQRHRQTQADDEHEEQEEVKVVHQEIEEQKIEAPQVQEKEPVYNSIRERYAKVLEQERREKALALAEQNRVSQSEPIMSPPSQLTSEAPGQTLQLGPIVREEVINQVINQEAPQEQAQPVGRENDTEIQGIIQMLSTKLLSQILSAGDLFHCHIAEKFEQEVEVMKQKYFSLWFENILKARIFLSDRHERVERALQKIGFLPPAEEKTEEKETEDEFNIEVIDMELLESKLNDMEFLKQVYDYILNDDENYD
uniref:Uncharacterized protein n=1 Tax=Euplotes harpa TaxID=151035 RepID=A0A7S3J384_9SPIT|mmetsp:Transcript_14253/g.16474  ORF Transcript_14253/g.16474 Transcript_14253/m.16474 type:complete len:545 (+) Transcript_14253:465-2099(+)